MSICASWVVVDDFSSVLQSGTSRDQPAPCVCTALWGPSRSGVACPGRPPWYPHNRTHRAATPPSHRTQSQTSCPYLPHDSGNRSRCMTLVSLWSCLDSETTRKFRVVSKNVSLLARDVSLFNRPAPRERRGLKDLMLHTKQLHGRGRSEFPKPVFVPKSAFCPKLSCLKRKMQPSGRRAAGRSTKYTFRSTNFASLEEALGCLRVFSPKSSPQEH